MKRTAIRRIWIPLHIALAVYVVAVLIPLMVAERPGTREDGNGCTAPPPHPSTYVRKARELKRLADRSEDAEVTRAAIEFIEARLDQIDRANRDIDAGLGHPELAVQYDQARDELSVLLLDLIKDRDF